jgi:hypothetical protein
MRFSDFRALIPTWLLFDDVGSGCRVQARIGDSPSALGPWFAVLAPTARGVWQLLHNPEENLRLHAIGLFERLVEESQEHLDAPEGVPELSTYKTCLSLLRHDVALPRGRWLQFRVQSRSEDVFISALHEV